MTYDDAINPDIREFHDGECRTWRRNGKTQTWKTRPGEFRIPTKYGLYSYGEITHHDAACYHVPGRDCQPVRRSVTCEHCGAKKQKADSLCTRCGAVTPAS